MAKFPQPEDTVKVYCNGEKLVFQRSVLIQIPYFKKFYKVEENITETVHLPGIDKSILQRSISEDMKLWDWNNAAVYLGYKLWIKTKVKFRFPCSMREISDLLSDNIKILKVSVKVDRSVDREEAALHVGLSFAKYVQDSIYPFTIPLGMVGDDRLPGREPDTIKLRKYDKDALINGIKFFRSFNLSHVEDLHLHIYKHCQILNYKSSKHTPKLTVRYLRQRWTK